MALAPGSAPLGRLTLTPFGKEVRKLRIDAEIYLYDMALALGVPPSYLSGVEVGRIPLTDEIVQGSIDYLTAKGLDAEPLKTFLSMRRV